MVLNQDCWASPVLLGLVLEQFLVHRASQDVAVDVEETPFLACTG